MNIMVEIMKFTKHEGGFSSKRSLIPIQSAIELTPSIDYDWYIMFPSEFPFGCSEEKIFALLKKKKIEKHPFSVLKLLKATVENIKYAPLRKNFGSRFIPLGIYNVGNAETTWEIEENNNFIIARLMLTNITNVHYFSIESLLEIRLNKFTKKIELEDKNGVQYINRDDVKSFSPSSKSYSSGMSYQIDTMLFYSADGSHGMSTVFLWNDLVGVPIKINSISCINNDIAIKMFKKFMEA